ncbi:MAG: preprotein translocase subunit TatB [Candidatus Melainabacteria bacterium RIFCSPLOWO2_02_FULL_35_15]|nr:MAG: preprotein translocase subunit TatB [Candidatus Melainabacteria bacterium RIFCSPLOWO2_12_FULL_35_11]OGI13996.1 MAG: preprotein translocase subunit TatB [Candidatus Melainabacteria bacterium RIFCSPLOWO2_02_FULL_35_15]
MTKPDITLDLRGIECPLNFVKTKIQLEKMQSGQNLEIFLDPGEAIESVPPSITEEGHIILDVKSIEGYFKVLIRKC